MNLSKDLSEFIALLNSTSVKYVLVGVDFEQAWNSRIKTATGAELFVISKELLVQNRRAQDLADIERLTG